MPDSNVNIQGTVYRLQTALPIVSGFSPHSGSASAGTIVAIRGVNLTRASVVTIGGISQTILSKTARQVKIKLNAATPTSSYPILVTTPHGTAASSQKFTVAP